MAVFSKVGVAVVLATMLLLPGTARAQSSAFTLSSPAFQQGGAIPARFTCEERDVSPPLAWSGLPANAKSLALIVDDPDAPDPAAPKATWVHWVLYDIPPDIGDLPDSLDAAGLPPGVRAGKNDFGKTTWGGPCPPVGKHRYVFKLYALDALLFDLRQPTKAKLEAAMKGHVIAKAELIGTYEKKK
jgi:Raf kinase inhibitor-like YbhB/YbcL family protein